MSTASTKMVRIEETVRMNSMILHAHMYQALGASILRMHVCRFMLRHSAVSMISVHIDATARAALVAGLSPRIASKIKWTAKLAVAMPTENPLAPSQTKCTCRA